MYRCAVFTQKDGVFCSLLDSGTMSRAGGVTRLEFLSVGLDYLSSMSRRFRTLEGFCLSSTPHSELTSSLLLTFVYLVLKVNLFMELY